MSRHLLKRLTALALSIALLTAVGLAAGDCPDGALAQDSVTVETGLGSFEVAVCVVHDRAAAEHAYTITVTNISVDCKLQSFGVVPLSGVTAELEPSGMWQTEIDEPYWWMWDGPSWQAIGSGRTGSFSFRVPDTAPIAGLSGAVFTSPASACGGNDLRFHLLGASETPEGGAAEGEIGSAVYSRLCRCQGETKTFPTAQRISVPSGYRAEYVVAPSGLNVPADVAIAPDGEIFVTSSRAGSIFRVELGGSLRKLASSHAYSIDVDRSGRLYAYDFPAGEVLAISSSGRAEVIARLPVSACESSLAVAPDGTVFIGANFCLGDEMDENTGGTLYRLRSDGYAVEALLEGIPFIDALDVSEDGVVYVITRGVQLNAVDPQDPRLNPVATLACFNPEETASGVAVARDGSVYVSTGAIQPEGALYRYDLNDDELTGIASFPGNGLQGIDVHPDGSVLAVQRAIGGLQRILPNGTVSAIVEPNGLVSPQAICGTPCGELVVVNDEAGWASIICPDGSVNPFVRMISYMPPLTYIASSSEGWIVAGESAPGFASRLVRYSQTGDREILATDIPDVSGVAIASDGTLYAAGTRANRIYALSPDGTRDVLSTDVRKPQALELSRDGRLFAIVNRETDVGFVLMEQGDAVVEILANGSARLVAEIDECYDLAIDDEGWIYVTAREKVWRIDEHGHRSSFASGFDGARGITFHDGHLYVTDDLANAIVRIVKIEAEESPPAPRGPRGPGAIP